MGSSDFDLIAGNCDILIRIYKLLKFQDQFRLACTCRQLRSVFEEFIWNGKPSIMKVEQIYGDKEIQVNVGISAPILQFSLQEFHEVFQYYGNRIEDLTLKGRLAIAANVLLPNLRTFCYTGFCREQDFELLSTYCPGLQELHLNQVFVEYNNYIGAINLRVIAKYLASLKNLSRITLSGPSKIEYADFQEMATKLKLDSFKTESYIVSNGYRETKKCRVTMQELDIKTTFDSEDWLGNFSKFLSIFENLTILTIQFRHPLRDEHIAILRRACQKLHKLTFRYTQFTDVVNCSLPSTVKDLTFYFCQGLTGANLKQILSFGKIQKFQSYMTFFKNFENFTISSNISTLNVDSIKSLNFKSAYENNKNLQEFSWEGDFYEENKDDVSTRAALLQTCINLEILNVAGGSIPSTTLLQLKHLRKLTISEDSKYYNWSYIVALLQHPALEELCIKASICRSNLWHDPYVPEEVFSTNIQTLTLDAKTLEVCLRFWLNLLQRNVHLKLVYGNSDSHNIAFLKKIINHELFPPDIKAIGVCGVILSKYIARRKKSASKMIVKS